MFKRKLIISINILRHLKDLLLFILDKNLSKLGRDRTSSTSLEIFIKNLRKMQLKALK